MGVRPRWRPRIPRRAQGGAAEGGHYAGCKSAAYLSQPARPLDRSTLTDSMRPYPTATQPQFKLNHKSGGRGKCAAHGDGETPAFYRTNFARAPARQSDGLTFGIPSPAFPRTDFARIRKADANSTISQSRYGRNQPPRNHEPTILRVESKNDTISTKPSYFSD